MNSAHTDPLRPRLLKHHNMDYAILLLSRLCGGE